MVIGGGAGESSAEVFDPREGRWTRLENMWSIERRFKSRMPSFCSGPLHALYKGSVMKYESGKNIWTEVASLPLKYPLQFQYGSSVTQWYGWLFVSLWASN